MKDAVGDNRAAAPRSTCNPHEYDGPQLTLIEAVKRDTSYRAILIEERARDLNSVQCFGSVFSNDFLQL